jgi:Flp pilus assembly protein TadG
LVQHCGCFHFEILVMPVLMKHLRQKARWSVSSVTGFAKTWRAREAERLCRIAARMRAGKRAGSAAIEFAFIAPIFLLFLMGTMETGIIFLGDLVLQNATNDAGRQIRTGQAAISAMTQDQFRQLICNKIGPLLHCDANLQIDVETFPTFGAVTMPSPVRADGTIDTTLNNWSPGTVCSIVLVRSFYTWTVATPLLTPFLVNAGSNQHVLSAATAFRNEPFLNVVAGC